ncbi:PAS domain-containing protein [Crossiella sp. CA-258035]|uniref:PAS domain-containing protein n=2 Tax=unclassified Crossiella TaxID=2620835 RepID=UPI0024BC8521|nr:PAS domain-containing protein [Crossiella sp. CA-258035]WHT16664.1 PAS domain-containing protein [Crossiella sp. CA-258035]
MSADVAATALHESVSGMRKVDDAQEIVRSLFDQSGICVATLDSSLRVIEANAKLLRLFGRSAGDTCGRTFVELLHASVRESVTQGLGRLLDGQKTRFTSQIAGLRSGEPDFSGELTGVAVAGEGGKVQRIMVIVRPEASDRSGHMLSSSRKLLTDMDARILEGVAAGISTVQLASMLHLSRGGVEYHVTTLLRRLKAKNRPALVSKAYSMGLFGVGSWPPRVLPSYVK